MGSEGPRGRYLRDQRQGGLVPRRRESHVGPATGVGPVLREGGERHGLPLDGSCPAGRVEGWEEVRGGGVGGGEDLRVVETLRAGGLHPVPRPVPPRAHPRPRPLVAETD